MTGLLVTPMCFDCMGEGCTECEGLGHCSVADPRGAFEAPSGCDAQAVVLDANGHPLCEAHQAELFAAGL